MVFNCCSSMGGNTLLSGGRFSEFYRYKVRLFPQKNAIKNGLILDKLLTIVVNTACSTIGGVFGELRELSSFEDGSQLLRCLGVSPSKSWHIFGRGEVSFIYIFLKMRKIVIHSTHAEFRALIRGLLTDIEAFFVPSSSREELFRICQTTKCDLVLTDDVRMFMNGSDAIEQIRQGSMLPQIFILSHDISEDTITALLEEGINQFITMPVAPERLRKKVASQYFELV